MSTPPITLSRLKSKLYTGSEIRVLLKISPYLWRQHLAAGLLPPPTTPLPEPTLYYTHADLVSIKTYFKGNPHVATALGLVSRRQMAKEVGLNYYTLLDLISSGRLPAPSVMRGLRQYYRGSDVEKMQEAVASLAPVGNHYWERLRQAGYYSLADVAKQLDMPLVTLQLWLRRGKLPKPQRIVPGTLTRAYRESDIKRLKKMLKERGYTRKPRRKK